MSTAQSDVNITTTGSPGTLAWSGNASVIQVTNNHATADMYLNVVGVHPADTWYPLGPGLTATFGEKGNRITAVYAYVATAATCRVMMNASALMP